MVNNSYSKKINKKSTDIKSCSCKTTCSFRCGCKKDGRDCTDSCGCKKNCSLKNTTTTTTTNTIDLDIIPTKTVKTKIQILNNNNIKTSSNGHSGTGKTIKLNNNGCNTFSIYKHNNGNSIQQLNRIVIGPPSPIPPPSLSQPSNSNIGNNSNGELIKNVFYFDSLPNDIIISTNSNETSITKTITITNNKFKSFPTKITPYRIPFSRISNNDEIATYSSYINRLGEFETARRDQFIMMCAIKNITVRYGSPFLKEYILQTNGCDTIEQLVQMENDAIINLKKELTMLFTQNGLTFNENSFNVKYYIINSLLNTDTNFLLHSEKENK